MPKDKTTKELVKDFRIPGLKNFRNFVYLLYKFRNFTPTKRQYEIADFLQSGDKRLILSAFRGCGKSDLAALYALWTLYWDQEARVLVVSASQRRVDRFAEFCNEMIAKVPELRWMAPRGNQRYSKIAFDVAGASSSQSPSLQSAGLYGQITGNRATLIIADDVETESTAGTQGARERLFERVKEFESILLVDNKDSKIVYLGTPHCEDSLYNELTKRGYKRLLWPARYPSEKWMKFNGSELAPSIAAELELDPTLSTGYGLELDKGAPVDPERFDDQALIAKEAGYGRSGAELQFMLDTSLSDQERYPLKLRDLIVLDVDKLGPDQPVWSSDSSCIISELPNIGFRGDRFYKPIAINGQWRKFEQTVMAIDPAGLGDDELAYAIIKTLNGVLYLVECKGLRGGFSIDNLQTLAYRAHKHDVNTIVIESNFGGGMFDQLFKPVLHRIHPCTIESVRHNKQKELRIIADLEPVMNSHKLVVCKSVIEDDGNHSEFNTTDRQLFYQLTRLSKDKGSLVHDDRLDALAIAVSWLSKLMNIDTEKQMKAKQLQDMDSFMDRFKRRKPSKTSWIRR